MLKVGGGANTYEVPLYLKVGWRPIPPIPPVAAPLAITIGMVKRLLGGIHSELGSTYKLPYMVAAI